MILQLCPRYSLNLGHLSSALNCIIQALVMLVQFTFSSTFSWNMILDLTEKFTCNITNITIGCEHALLHGLVIQLELHDSLLYISVEVLIVEQVCTLMLITSA